jgi:adenylate kinase
VNVIILGAPGSGKGTQAKRLAESKGMRHVSTGDLLREAVAKQTELGKQVQDIMAAGKLVPDEIVFDLVKEAVTDHSNDDTYTGWILDGYPRNVEQADQLEDMLSAYRETVEAVVSLDVDADEIVERLSNRRSCMSCNAVYNLLNQPPKQEGQCDACGDKLVQRDDDKPETIRKRIEVYNKKTLPILTFYDERYDVHRIDGSRPIDDVTSEIARLSET